MNHPAHAEIAELHRLRARADKIHADASRWPVLLDQAQANLVAAQETFISALDANAAAAVADAAVNFRALVSTCDALAKAGGPESLRFRALSSPEVFAVFAAGFEKRHAALEKLKPAARAAYSRATAAAVAAGADPQTLIGLNTTPAMRDAGTVLDRLDCGMTEAHVLLNYAKAPAQYSPRPFDELLDLLAAPLPVVSAA